MKFYLGLPLMFALSMGVWAAPHIVVEQPRWNFGLATNRLMLTHEFLIRNSGDETLKISRVLSSCNACLSAHMEQTNLPPGGTSMVAAYLDLRMLTGALTRDIMIDSNDPKTPSVVLQLDGVAVPAYRMVPPEVSLDLSQNQSATTVEITALFEDGAALTQATCSDTNVLPKIIRRADGKNEYLLTLQVLDSLPRGNMACMVTVGGIDSNTPPCQLMCYLRNPPDLELIPPQLKLQAQDTPQMRILWIRQHGAEPLILLDVIPPSDKFRLEIVPDSIRNNYRINVSAWRQKTDSGRTNWLTLKMRDQKLKERLVAVPISVN